MTEEVQNAQAAMQEALNMSLDPNTPVEVEGSAVIAAPEVEATIIEEPGTIKEVVAVAIPIVEPAPEITPEIIEEDPALIASFDENAWIKEKFGDEFESADQVKAKLSAPAPVYKEPEFANEESKRIYEATISGDFKPLKEFLDKKEFVASLADKSPEDLVKAQWKHEYNLTDSQADRRFSQRFSVDDLLEDEDQEIEKKIQQAEINKLAAQAKDFFASYVPDITLPSIAASAPASANLVEETVEAKNAFTFSQALFKDAPKEAGGVAYSLKDDSRGLNYKGQIPIPQDEITKIKQNLTGQEAQWFKSRFIKPDNTVDDDAFARLVYLDANLTKVIQSAIVDASTQTWKAKMKVDKNYSDQQKIIQGGLPVESTNPYTALFGTSVSN